MGLFRSGVRLAAKTLADSAMLPTIKMLGAGLWDQVRNLRDACPVCKRGRMQLMHAEVDGVMVYGLGCSRCAHVASIDIPGDLEWSASTQQMLIQSARDRVLAECEKLEVSEDHAGILMRMRIFALFAFSCAAGALGLSLWGAWNNYYLMFLNCLCLSVLFFVLGLKQSYRRWQLLYKRFYEPGLFKEWFMTGNWFV